MNKTTLIPLPVLLFALLFSLLLIGMQPFQPELIFNRRAIQTGEAWRIWSGNFVHTNDYHLYLNLAGLWIFLLLCGSAITTKLLISSIFFASTVIGVALFLLNPELYWYAGLSGVLYALFVVGAISLAVTGEIISFLVLMLLVALKLATIWFGDSDQLTQGLIKARIIEEAHLYGAVAGAISALPLLIKKFHPHKYSNPEE